MKNKIKFGLLISALVIGLFVNTSIDVESSEALISSVQHTPSIVTISTLVSVEITFYDATNVTGVQIQYCAIEPNYLCHFPKIEMISQSSNIWEGNFSVVEENGIIGYELIISLNNGSTIYAPDSIDYLNYDNIMEPVADVFYFVIELRTQTQSAPLSIGLFEIGLAISSIVILRTINKKRNKW